MNENLILKVTQFLAKEALALDMKQWEDWLALLSPDVVFWMPAWKNETERSQDPEAEISLFYFDSRHALEDRVWRLNQQKSIASMPLLRTTHVTSNVLVGPVSDDSVEVRSSWVCYAFNPKRKVSSTFFGRSKYEILTSGEQWLIQRKKIILMNDYIPTMMDFYCC